MKRSVRPENHGDKAVKPLRIVVDANVIVSALIRPSGPPGQVLALVQSNEVMPVLSEDIMAEIRRCLSYPTIRQRVNLSEKDMDLFLPYSWLRGNRHGALPCRKTRHADND
jgi:hypothetical protein